MSTAKRTIVITGASAGVGRATAVACARRGDRVALLARGWDGLAAARQEVLDAGGEALAVPTDVADAAQVERAALAVEDTFGAIDVWINNAMASVFSPVLDMTPDEFRRVTEVTYLGTVHGTMAALRRMRARDRGTIVQVGSALAYRSIPLQSAYCAAKHAVKGFTESLLCELRHDRSHVEVVMVHLPAINTPQFDWVRSRLPGRAQPVPPVFQPEVAAEAILWAVDHPRRERLLGWPTVKAIFGEKLAPGVADRYLARIGYDAQQTKEPEEPGRPDNLWFPLPGDHGAHGRFDAQAKTSSSQFWLSRHRGLVATAFLGAAALVAGRRLRS
jgi:NAD(P)-dependent dehydrogenase (short-subunit alcohol dehydrogenase family)